MIFDDPDFLVVDFAEKAKKWTMDRGDFTYISMEADENPMISFNVVSEEKLSIRTFDVELETDELLDVGSVYHAMRAFIARLSGNVKTDFGIDLSRIM